MPSKIRNARAAGFRAHAPLARTVLAAFLAFSAYTLVAPSYGVSLGANGLGQALITRSPRVRVQL